MAKKILTIKPKSKTVLIALLIITLLGFIVARFPEMIANLTNQDSGKIHGIGEKIYTVGIILIIAILAISVIANPLVMVLLLATSASLVYHLIQKFK